MSKRVHLIRCGLGDFITFIKRWSTIPDIKETQFIVVAGGYYGVPKLMEQFWKSSGLAREVVNKFVVDEQFVEGRPQDVDRAYKKNVEPILNDGDIFENWLPVQMHHTLKLPKLVDFQFDIDYDPALDNISFAKPVCVIHPRTTGGNAAGNQVDRYWPQQKWSSLVRLLQRGGCQVVQIGSQGDRWDLGADVQLFGKPISHSFYLLSLCDLAVTCNSWSYEISVSYNTPSIVFYWHNNFWSSLHIHPDHNIKVIADRNASVQYIGGFLQSTLESALKIDRQ